jgi:hypothetical protein
MEAQVPFFVRRGARRTVVSDCEVVVGRVARLTSLSCRAITTMHSTRDAGLAGFMIVSSVILCAGIGAGLGALVGAPGPLAVIGVFGGFGVGLRLVYARYRDI